MKIKRLSASFGALKDQKLAPGPGLTIVRGPNEKGKSTWCAFIRAMLYGIHTSERRSDGFLPEKAKYQPWSGHPMEGILEVETEDGRAISIQRTALGSYPMKRLDVRYSGTGEEVIALMHDNLGEVLTGVPEAVFVRSAFIRQDALKISQTGQLEQRIAALVSAGEEGVSYSDTTGTLGAWQRKRRHNKTGQIPALETEIAALDQTLARVAEASAAYNEVSLELDRAVRRAAELREAYEAHVELERRRARQNILEARNQLQALDTEIAALRKKLNQNGMEVTKTTIAEARASYDKLGAASMRYNEAKTEKEIALEDVELLQEAKTETNFAGRNLEEAKELVRQAETANQAAAAAASFNRQKYTFPMGILFVFALASLAASLVAEFTLPAWPASGVAVSGLALLMAGLVGAGLYRKWRIAGVARKTRDEMLLRFRVGSMEALEQEFEAYRDLCEKETIRSGVLTKTEAIETQAKEEMQALKDTFERQVKAFAPDTADFAAAHEVLMETGRQVDRLEAANRERAAAAHLHQTLTAGYDDDPNEPIPRDGLQVPLHSKSETAYELKRIEKELDILKSSYGVALGEVRALGDPMILNASRGTLEARLKDLTCQYEALGFALEVLTEADSEITARFSPLLGQRAGYYIDRLTGGAYKRVLFDKSLFPSAERAGESIARDILYLSGGTVDQIYLALRLAICDLTFPPEKSCPIILDDALVSFDAGRMHQALALLKELSAERQIILFTCHDREAAAFAGDQEVSVVNL